MPVHHITRKQVRALEEGRADEDEILVRLLVQRNFRPHAGMDKDVPRGFDQNRHRAQQRKMSRRNRSADRIVDLLLIAKDFDQPPMIDAVRLQRAFRAHAQPGGKTGPPVEIVEHGKLMIAGQADALQAHWRMRCEMVEHLRRRGTTIDIIPQHDDQLATRQRRRVANDGVFQRQKLVQATMHVADRIDDGVRHIETQARQASPGATCSQAKNASDAFDHLAFFMIARVLAMARRRRPIDLLPRVVLCEAVNRSESHKLVPGPHTSPIHRCVSVLRLLRDRTARRSVNRSRPCRGDES